MGEKRKLSTRARGELQRKRTPTPPPEPISPGVQDEGLPTRLQEGKPLPTLSEPQPIPLSTAGYQTIVQR